MRIRLMLPYRTLLDEAADKVTAPGTEGVFQLLPRHVDGVFGLQSGILSITRSGQDVYYAIDRGVLVKQGDTVLVSCYEAVRGDSLARLNAVIAERFREVGEREKKTRQVLMSMEMNTKIRLKQLQQ